MARNLKNATPYTNRDQFFKTFSRFLVFSISQSYFFQIFEILYFSNFMKL